MQLARDFRIPVVGELGAVLGDGVQRGSVVTVGGVTGAGVTRTAFEFAASVTAAGEWVAFVGGDTLGLVAAAELGVELERCAVVHDVPSPKRWPVVVGALLDGMTMVIAVVPPRLALGDARRLLARARERRAVLVALESAPTARAGTWPAEAALRVQAQRTSWSGLDAGGGLLASGTTHFALDGRDARLRLARAG